MNIPTSAKEESLPTRFCIDPSTIIRQSIYPTAAGCLGDVYRCTWNCDAGFDEVAVKSIRFLNPSEDQSAEINKSLDREIYIWAILEHEYVLPFYGTVEGFGPFRALVSPWMPKGNLDSYLTHAGETLTAMDRLRMLKQITEGLMYLHGNDIIHGDLTSNNVMIAADGSPRLADFGISNIVMLTNPTFSEHTGAFRWAAPEFMIIPEDRTIQYGTKSSDIYALGGIMLQVLYGKQPYWWLKSPLHVVTAKYQDMEPINSSIQIEPNHLDFMRRCWSTDSTARPSVEDVLAFLQERQVHLIQTGATRPRGDWRRNPYLGPSNDTHHHPNPSGRSPSSARQQHISPLLPLHGGAPPGRTIISSPSRSNDHSAGSRTPPRFLEWARNSFFSTRNSRIDKGIGLHERRPEVVDVPLAQGVPRYFTAREVQKDKKKARETREAEKQKARETKNAKNTKLAPASSSRPSESNVNPQPGEGAQTQPTPGSYNSSAHPVSDLHVTFETIRQKDGAADGDEESERDGFYDARTPQAENSEENDRVRDEDQESDEDVDLLVDDISLQLSSLTPSWGPVGSVREIGGEDIEDRSSRSATIVTSENQPILTSFNPKSISSHSHHAQLSVSMYSARDLGPAVDDSDEYTSVLRPLMDYMGGDNFDLRGISASLSSPSPDVQCAALQLLEHAAEWESINFAECMSVTFGPVVKLLDSRDSEVRYAALDTLKLFLASPRATDVVKSTIPRLVDAVLDNLNSPDPLVQRASVELLDAAARSEEVLVRFAVVVSRLPRAFPSMPIATQVIALRVLEVSTGSNTPELVRAVAGTFQCLSQPLSSPETTVQIAALKVLEACTRTKDPELVRVVKDILPELTKIQSSGGTDIRNAARKLLEWVAHHDQLSRATSVVSGPADTPDTTYHHSDGRYLTSAKEVPPPKFCIDPRTIMRQSPCPNASGGLSDVYKCTWKCDTGSDEVAVKSNRFYLSEDQAAEINKACQSLDHEIDIWAILKHEYVLPFYGTVEGFGPFRALVAPWMPHGNLDSYLERAGETLTAMDRLRMLKQITEGLKYLHGNDIIHGDLTSNHVMIAADGSPRLADFGISHIVMRPHPTLPHHTGTVRWAAPESIAIQEDQAIQYGTKSSDIYALGSIMLQVLYGKQPYWWLRSPTHVVSARYQGMEPINSSIQIRPDHLEFMRQCWSAESTVRPSVEDVLKFLQVEEALLKESQSV